jgi:hypothetical protein
VRKPAFNSPSRSRTTTRRAGGSSTAGPGSDADPSSVTYHLARLTGDPACAETDPGIKAFEAPLQAAYDGMRASAQAYHDALDTQAHRRSVVSGTTSGEVSSVVNGARIGEVIRAA